MKDFLQIILLLAILGLLIQQRQGSTTKVTSKRRKMVLDTCALIDGRIVELTKLGFVPEELIVPEFVLHELQMLADGNDSHKRERARFGLDVVKELQEDSNTTVIIDRSITTNQPTDDKLVALAKKLGVGLYTTDYNLNKVADIEGVLVLNVNELAQQLRPTALPGERKIVKILQKGSNPKQGVGYLDDGTMVVVDDAASQVNKMVEVEVTRIHQTMAGKMLFANLISKPVVHNPRRRNTQAQVADTSQQDDIHQCTDVKPSIQLSISPTGGNSYTLTANVGQGTHPLSSAQYPGTVTFSVDGQVLSGGSFTIGSSGSVSMNYTSDGTAKTVTATIVDSVLYDASDTGTTPGGGSQSAGPLKLNKPTISSGTIYFTWSGGKGPYSVTKGAVPVCSGGIGTTSCSGPSLGNGSYKLTDGNSDTDTNSP